MQHIVKNIYIILNLLFFQTYIAVRESRMSEITELIQLNLWLQLPLVSNHLFSATSQSYFSDLMGSLWIMDFWCWTSPVVAILGANQREHGLRDENIQSISWISDIKFMVNWHLQGDHMTITRAQL